MSRKGIAQFLMKHAGLTPVSFHMPGHKGSKLYRTYGYEEFLNSFFDCDITEIPGADNLFMTEGIIRDTSEKYAELYEVKKSYLLINGTSGGLIAAVLASVRPGKKLIMSRNCHKSVFNALTLGNISPIYAYPSVVSEYGISGPVLPEEIERLTLENPEADAVVLPSPNYYGICSDIKKIADVVHKHGKILIVDQAHGAHLKFFSKLNGNIPLSAEECGADITVNSTHKTLASLTQSAVLNMNSDRVSQDTLEDKLQAIESTSPSYILMASLDINADIIKEHGSVLFEKWTEDLQWFYEKAEKIPGMKLMRVPRFMDETKINIDLSAYGINGNELEKMLMKRHIYPELATGNILMCMTGIGNTREDMIRLLCALEEISKNKPLRNNRTADNAPAECTYLWTKQRPLHSIPTKKQALDIDKCCGRISGSSIIPYPPGIPLVCPGEEIDREDIEYVKLLRQAGEKIIGFSKKNQLIVGAEERV